MVSGQQFSPPQLLEAGHRAEAEGRLDLAAQFYRYLTEYFAFTPEAAEARNGLGRIRTSSSPLWQMENGPQLNGSSPSNGAHVNGAARAHPRRLSSPRDHYRMGRLLSVLLTAAGWTAVASGIAGPMIHTGLPQFAQSVTPDLPLSHVLEVAAALVGSGLLIILSGHISRAVFDQANAMRDLAALEREKIWSE